MAPIDQYIQLLLKWNRVFNLTAHRAAEKIRTYDVADSLALLPYLHGNTVLDVGSGGGFPGIPLAIHCPEKQFTLLDANGKKTRFLVQAIAELKLANVTVVNERVENFKGAFETITSRALTGLAQFVDLTQHVIAPGGQWLAMKGQYPEDELQALAQPAKVHSLTVDGLDAERHLIVIQA